MPPKIWSTLNSSVGHTGTVYEPAASACVLSLKLGLGGMREAKTIYVEAASLRGGNKIMWEYCSSFGRDTI